MIADELNKLKQTKAQIKQALIDKGQNPTDEFASYVGNIAGISSGEDPFLPLGYSIPQTILEAINYGYQLKQDVENGIITRIYQDKNLVFLPNINYDNKNITLAFNCPSLLFIDTIDFSKSTGSLVLSDNTALMKVNTIILPNKTNGVSCRNFFSGDKQLKSIGRIEGKISDAYSFFHSCEQLTSFPKLDTSLCSEASHMFSGCKSLTSIDISDWDFSNVKDMNQMFYNCSNLVDLKLPDNLGSSGSMYSMFYGCKALSANTDFSKINISKTSDIRYFFQAALYNFDTLDLTSWDVSKQKNFTGFIQDQHNTVGDNLREINLSTWTFESATTLSSMFAMRRKLQHIDISNANTSKVTNFSSMFQWNDSLTAVKGAISMKSYTSTTNSGYMFSNITGMPLRYITFKDIGYNSGNTKWDIMYYNGNWGIENESDEWTIGARNTLTNSLITYSFDRVAAGYSTCTITLHANTKALLTEDEIAQITAKGYTIA